MEVLSSNPVTVPRFIFINVYLFIYLCNCLNIVHNQLHIILLAEYETVHILLSWCIRLLNMKSPYPIELMYSVAEYETVHVLLRWCILLLNTKQSISYWVDAFCCWIWNSPYPIELMHSVAEYETVHTLLSWCIRLLNMKQSISYWVYAFCSILHMRSRVCLCRI